MSVDRLPCFYHVEHGILSIGAAFNSIVHEITFLPIFSLSVFCDPFWSPPTMTRAARRLPPVLSIKIAVGEVTESTVAEFRKKCEVNSHSSESLESAPISNSKRSIIKVSRRVVACEKRKKNRNW